MNDLYLILFNIAKYKNLGGLIRTANALGVSEVIVVGRKQVATYGNFQTKSRTPRRHFFDLASAAEYLHGENCRILGIEITNDAEPIHSHPFQGSTAFLPGNEGTGLTDSHRAVCDGFVYIPQYGTGASLNVNVATGIVLHHYSVWAGREENPREGQKFVVSGDE